MYSNPEKFYKMCLRKKRLSEKVADKIIKKAKSEGKTLYKYLCPYCFSYHLTKKPNDNIIEIKKSDDKYLYILRVNNRKIFEITKEDYEKTKKDKSSDILISKEYYIIIPKQRGCLVFTKEYPNMESILERIGIATNEN